MPDFNYEIPPHPRGATVKEQRIIDRLNRAVEKCRDPDVRPEIGEGLQLILDLIEDREKRRRFDEHYDRPREDC